MRLRVRVQQVLLLLKATTTSGSSSGSSSESRAHTARGKQAVQILLTVTGVLVCAKGMYIFESSPWAPLTSKHDGCQRSASTVAAANRKCLQAEVDSSAGQGTDWMPIALRMPAAWVSTAAAACCPLVAVYCVQHPLNIAHTAGQ